MIIKVTIPHQIQLKVAPKFKSMFFSKKDRKSTRLNSSHIH